MRATDLSAQIDTHLDELIESTDQARTSAEMTKYLDFCAKFHHYSPSNIWLILLQYPTATFIAGFAAWKKMGRFVRKGEKAIKIIAPILYRENLDEKEPNQILRGFRIANVFDVSQTDGNPLPQTPNWKSPQKNAELHKRLLGFAKGKGIQIHIKDLEGEAQGLSKGGCIVLSPKAGIKTFFHEIAHELLHQQRECHITKNQMELEAEAIAFVVSRHFGIEDLNSSNYLILNGTSKEMFIDHMTRIKTTSAEIINALEIK